MVVKNAAYWSSRRRKQFGRFAGKSAQAYMKPSVPAIARAAWSGVKYLRTLVNSETHKLDTSTSGNVTTTATITHITAIAQGDGINQRTGNSILVNYIYMRTQIVLNASATTSMFRLLLIRDLQQVGDTAPALLDVLTTADCNSFLNANNVGRFKILHDCVYSLDNAQRKQLFFKKYIKLNQHVRYNGSASSDIQKGGIYLMVLSDQTTNPVQIYNNVRINWHDN